MTKVETPIANAFKEWLKKAKKEELQKFCDDANALAIVLKSTSKIEEDNLI